MDKEWVGPTAKMTVAGVGTAFSSLTLNEWVACATLIYVVLQIGLLLPKYWAVLFRKGRNK